MRIKPNSIVLGLLSGALFISPLANADVSDRPGMGATPYIEKDGAWGTTFRTWAPNANSVSVAGSFNGWSSTQFFLSSEGEGVWSMDVPFVGVGDEYQFIVRQPGLSLWRNDPYARRVTQSNGVSIVYDAEAYEFQNTDYQTPPFNDWVIYEMHVGTFDGSVASSLDDAIKRLDHLVELGVNMVELMPVCEFPGDISWGYNPSHPFAVESAYGGPDALKRFVDAAHGLGIGVMLDVVYNHLGPTDLSIWQYDGWSQNGFGGIYFYNDERAVTPWGDTRPDFGRGEVREYLRNNAMMWLEEFWIDGLRVDGTKYIRSVPEQGIEIADGWSWMMWLNESVNDTQPWKMIVAEDFGDDDWISRPTESGGAGFDAQWDGAFFNPVRGAVEAPSDADRSMWGVHDGIYNSFNGNPFERVVYTESHDEVANGRARVPEDIWPGNADSWYSKKRSTLAAAIAFTSPGIPLMFMGQEFLEDEWFSDDRPLDWSKKDEFAGIFQLYRDLISMRRNLGGATKGLMGSGVNVYHVNDWDKAIAFQRWYDGGVGDDVVVVANFSNTYWSDYRIGFPQGGHWYCIFNSEASQYDPEFSNLGPTELDTEETGWDGMPQSGSFVLPPYTVLVFSQKQIDSPGEFLPEDINQDGTVNGADLALVLAAWSTADPAADFDANGIVDGADLARVLAAWSG